jgi:hypothetical protein
VFVVDVLHHHYEMNACQIYTALNTKIIALAATATPIIFLPTRKLSITERRDERIHQASD